VGTPVFPDRRIERSDGLAAIAPDEMPQPSSAKLKLGVGGRALELNQG